MKSRMDVFIRRQRIQSCKTWIDRALIAEAFFIAILPNAAVIALILGIFAWIIRLRLDRKFTLRQLPLDFPVALFALISFASTFNSTSIGFSLLSWFETVGFYIATYIFFGQNLRTLDQIKNISIALFASAGFVVLYSIYQIFFGLDTAELPWLDPKIQPTARNRIYSTWTNPNLLAGYLDVCICLAIGIIENASDWMKQSIFTLAIITFAILLSLTFSRAAILTFAIISIVYGLKFDRRLIALFAVISIGILYFEPGLVERLLSSFDFDDDQSSIALRASLWQSTLLMISDHPFLGVGWGSYRFAFEPYNFLLNQSHSSAEIFNASNLYLNFAAEIGIAGMISILWCVAEPIIIAFRLEWLEEKIQAFRIRIQTFIKIKVMKFFTPPDEKIPDRPKVDLKKHPKIESKIEDQIEKSPEQKKSLEVQSSDKSSDQSPRATVISFEQKRHEKISEQMSEGSIRDRLKTNLRIENLFNWTETELFNGLRLGIGLALISILINGFAYDLPSNFASAVFIWILISILICVNEIDFSDDIESKL
ncbi:MAG: O-antigen ligase family protein [Selenomonadaceae bacterium]|nr:O-antigen ligase family protein [Selenomonadaceae bacterium]